MPQIKPLYEDNHLIAINKPVGFLVQGDKTGDPPLNELVKEYIRLTYNKPGAAYLGTIHRLDRPASGVLIFAKTSKALGRMNRLFADRKIVKKYWMLTNGIVQEHDSKLIHYLFKDRKKNYSKVYDIERPGLKKAILHYSLTGSLKGVQLYEINLETGRSHQVRAQMAKIGCPVLGDLKYGANEALSDSSIALHCRSMLFSHPVSKQEISIIAPLPQNKIWSGFRNIEV